MTRKIKYERTDELNSTTGCLKKSYKATEDTRHKECIKNGFLRVNSSPRRVTQRKKNSPTLGTINAAKIIIMRTHAKNLWFPHNP